MNILSILLIKFNYHMLIPTTKEIKDECSYD